MLERGAPRFAKLGDARAYFGSPEFAAKVAARLARKQLTEQRRDRRPVKRAACVVSLASNAEVTGQPDAIASEFAPDERHWLDAVIADAGERAANGATEAELRASLSRTFAEAKPDLDAERLGTAVDLALRMMRLPLASAAVPQPEPFHPARRFRQVSDETLELVRIWVSAVLTQHCPDATLEPLGSGELIPEFSPRDYCAAWNFCTLAPAGRIAFAIEPTP